jgi:hypothetical protein
MPDMELEPPSDSCPPELFAWIAILSYLRWPGLGEGEARRTFMLSMVASALGSVDAIEEEGPPEERKRADECYRACFGNAVDIVRSDLFTNYFNRLGGFRGLGDVPPLDHDTLRDWRMVGAALTIIRSIDVHHRYDLRGGASLKKAAFIVVESLKATGGKMNDTYFNQAWMRFRRVAHLCAALNWLIDRDKELFDMRGLGMFLSVARNYQAFAASFRASSQTKGSERSLVDPEIMWRVPGWPEIPDLSPSMISGLVRPLPASTFALARRYRAP